jgi:hypothetical protein
MRAVLEAAGTGVARTALIQVLFLFGGTMESKANRGQRNSASTETCSPPGLWAILFDEEEIEGFLKKNRRAVLASR